MPRIDLFEFNEQPWLPAPIRETQIEALGRTLRWAGIMRALAPRFREFCARSGADEVLDLCSGSGEAAELLAGEMARGGGGGPVPRFVLTDLFPQEAAWEGAVSRSAGGLRYWPEGVDATRIPPALGDGRARMIINALHQFGPDHARAILEDAVAQGRGVFVAENFERSVRGVLACGLYGLPAVLCTPVAARRHRLRKALVTWLVPASVLTFTWDGLASALRIYSEPELRALAPARDGWEWVYGTFAYPPFGRGMCFYGVPRSA